MVETEINGRWSLLLPEHRAAREEWATGWEVERIDSMHDLLLPGMVLYDVGTEEGDLSALFAQWVDGSYDTENIEGQPVLRQVGGVVLCEPNARVWPNVRAIWEANNLPAPLGFIDGFVAELDGWDELTFVRAAEHGGAFSREWPTAAFGPVIGDHGFCRVEERPDLARITIDTLATRTRPPDAITMDVEGAELLVLRGAERVLREHRPIVWASVHPEFMAIHYGQYEATLIRWMRDLGYTAEHLAFDHEHHWLFMPEAQ